MWALPAAIEAERAKTITEPMWLVEIVFYGYGTERVCDVGEDLSDPADPNSWPGYTYPGDSNFFKRMIKSGDLRIKQSREGGIDDVEILLDNAACATALPNGRYWSTVYNAMSVEDWYRSTIKIYRTFRTRLLTVTGATNTSPIEITVSEPHLLVNGNTVELSDVGGNTAANSVPGVSVVITSTGTYKFTIPVAGNGAYTSGGYVRTPCLVRQQVYEGFLELPEGITSELRLRSKPLINNLEIKVPTGGYQQTCLWVGQFGDNVRCAYNRPSGVGKNGTLASPGIDAAVLAIPLDPATSKRVQQTYIVDGSPGYDADGVEIPTSAYYVPKEIPIYAKYDVVTIESEDLLVDSVTINGSFIVPRPGYPDSDNTWLLDSGTTITSLVLNVTSRGYNSTTPAAHASPPTKNVIHKTCPGTWDACKDRNVEHRFGALRKIKQTGSYTYREQRRFWFDKRRSESFESVDNADIYGNVIPIPYGVVKVEADVVWFVDKGPYLDFRAILGWGPIAGLIDPPTNLDYEKVSGGSHNSTNKYVLVNNKGSLDYAIYRGNDGSAVFQGPGSNLEQQGLDYLWTNPPSASPTDTVYKPECGQTYSRLAYLSGTFPSTNDKNQEKVDSIIAYMRARMVNLYDAAGLHRVVGIAGVGEIQDTKVANWLDGEHDNPAWVWLDLLTNVDYGGRLAATYFNLVEQAKAAYICYNEGFKFAHIFREKLSLRDALQLVQSACRGYMVYENGLHFMRVHDSAWMINNASRHVFSNANIKDRSEAFAVQEDSDSLANQVEVPYIDPDQDYASVPRILDDDNNQDAVKKQVKSRRKFVGVIGFAHADKLAYYWMNRARLQRRKDGCKRVGGSVEVMHLQIGDKVSLNLSELDLQAQQDYEVQSIENNGWESDFYLERSDSSIFNRFGIEPDITVSPPKDRNRAPYNVAPVTTAVDYVQRAISLTWTVPTPTTASAAPAPAWVLLYSRLSTETLKDLILLARVPSGKLSYLHKFPDPMTTATMQFIFAVESVYGIASGVQYIRSATLYTTLTSAVAVTDLTLAVADRTKFAVNDLVYLGPEICKVQTITAGSGTTGTLNLYNAGGVRTTYENTSRGTQLAGSYVGVAVLNVPSFSVDVHAGELPIVTGFDVTPTRIFKNGKTMLRLSVTFTKPDAVADPNGIWNSIKLFRTHADALSGTHADQALADTSQTDWMLLGELMADDDSILIDHEGMLYTGIVEGAFPANLVCYAISRSIGGETGDDQLENDDAAYDANPNTELAKVTPTTKLAQSFQVSANRTIGRIKLWLARTGTFSALVSVTVSIQTNSAGAPSGTKIASWGSATGIDCTAIAVGGGWANCDNNTDVNLIAGTTYWIVIEPNSGYNAEYLVGSRFIEWGIDAAIASYASGLHATWVSSTWTPQSGKDALFRIMSWKYPRVIVSPYISSIATYVPVFDVSAHGDLFVAEWCPPIDSQVSPLTVTGASYAAGIEIEITVSTAHSLQDNDLVWVSGVTGNTNANGWCAILVTGTTTFRMKNVFGNASWISGGTVYKLISLEEIDNFYLAFSSVIWSPSHLADSGAADIVLVTDLGASVYKDGRDANAALYWALGGRMKTGEALAWNHLMAGGNYKLVTATDVQTLPTIPGGYVEIAGGGAAGALTRYAFTASGGETYIQLATLADLSRTMIVAFAAFGGSMSILRLTTHFTVSNTSGYTRITILNADSSPYTFVAGDIADIWSTPA